MLNLLRTKFKILTNFVIADLDGVVSITFFEIYSIMKHGILKLT